MGFADNRPLGTRTEVVTLDVARESFFVLGLQLRMSIF